MSADHEAEVEALAEVKPAEAQRMIWLREAVEGEASHNGGDMLAMIDAIFAAGARAALTVPEAQTEADHG